MRNSLFITLVICLMLFTSCSEETPGIESCGDGICDAIEAKKGLCLEDCTAQLPPSSQQQEVSSSITLASAGESFITHIPSDGIGNIAVQVTLPKEPRYSEGAPLIVFISTFFTPQEPVFDTQFTDVTHLGFAHVTYLWPGKADPSGAESDGTYDYGGEDSIQALKDVILFTGGKIPDSNGHYIQDWTDEPLAVDNIGLYAFSHPGIAATNVLSLYPDDLSFVSYFVGRENPTSDRLYALEPGYWDERTAVYNPYYQYPSAYDSTALDIDYSTVQWSIADDAPYFDTNGNKALDSSEFVLGYQRPKMYGKEFYSRALLTALNENDAFSDASWPAYLATPDDATELWPFRETVFHYDTFPENTKVLLVFSVNDHVQTALDKPHIHQAYDGFSQNAIWVRLNPDASYVASLNSALSGPDNDANSVPEDWSTIVSWAHPNNQRGTVFVPLAAVAEMADRVYMNVWDNNLDDILVEYETGDLR